MLRSSDSCRLLWLSMTCGLLFSGCGFGTAGLLGSSGGDSSTPGNAPSTPAGLLVLDAKVSPAVIRIVVTDAESDRATVDLRYVLPGETEERPMQQIGANPAQLESSVDGKQQDLAWDFAQEVGIPSDSSLLAGVTVIARVVGGTSQTIVADLGNDAPVVDSIVAPATEVSGIVNVSLRVADTSGDPVDISAEFFDESEPGAGWRPARPAGTNGTTSGLAFSGVVAPPAGLPLTFFWDTDSRDAAGNPIGDLVDLERTVRLRFLASDSVAAQAVPPESQPFRVDNNDVPLIQLDEGTLLSTADRVGGIPISYRLFDQESDPISVLLQWRLASQAGFPDLEVTDRSDLAVRLLDPAYLQEKQICRPFQTAMRGRARPIDATRVALPELGEGAFAGQLAQGLVGRSIEFMRSLNQPAELLAASWSQNPVQAPVATFAWGPLTAIVVDDRGGQTSVVEVRLTDGALLRTFATIAGTPTAACLTDSTSLLVAVDPSGVWQLHEVPLAGNGSSLRASRPLTAPAAPVRGIASASSQSALLTTGSEVQLINWSAAATVTTIAAGLSEPHGIVIDPNRRDFVYIAERTASGTGGPGRITKLDRSRNTRARLAGLPPSPRPTALAVAGDGLLHAVCQLPSQSTPTLVSIALAQDADSFQVPLPAGTRAVSVGPDQQLLAAITSANIAVSGGVAQRRTITAFDPATRIATCDPAFAPGLAVGQSWRLAAPSFLTTSPSSPTGTPANFVWDSSDAPSRGGILLRAVAVDSESGLPFDTTGPLDLAIELERDPRLFSPGSSNQIASADLDSDGDLEIVIPGISILSRASTGGLELTTTVSPGGGGAGSGIAIADMNNDGRLDLVTTRSASPNPEGVILLQDAGGSFSGTPIVFGVVPSGPIKLFAGDFDADGLTDVLVQWGFAALLFHQDSPGTFQDPPQVLDGPGQGLEDLEVGDLDGNGLLDVGLAKSDLTGGSGTALVLRQTQPRTYQVTFNQSFGSSNPTSIAFGDVDRDGADDVVVGSHSFSGLQRVGVSRQTSPGQFSSLLFLELPDIPSDTSECRIADVDDDGNRDLVLADAGGYVGVLFQTAPGVFTLTPTKISRPGLPSGLVGNIIDLDLDGDGRLDLVTGGGSGLTVFGQSVSAMAAAAATSLGGATSTSGTAPVVAGDFDGSGGLDLAGTNIFDLSMFLAVFTQNVDGTFVAQPQSTFFGGQYLNSLASADVDGDGDTDIFYSASNSGTVGLARQQAGVFTTTEFDTVATRILRAADLDGDGDTDLAYLTQSNSQVRFRWQAADGSFAVGTQTLPGGLTMALGDINQDGLVDVIVGQNGQVSLHRQTQPGQFEPIATVFGVPGSVQSMALGDLDMDGDLDLAIGTSSNLVLAFQSGAGNFSGPQTLVAGNRTSVVAGDFDRDGLTDIATVRNNGLAMVRQVSRGQFAALPSVTAGPTLDDLSIADIDADGTVDILATAGFELRVFYLGR